MDAEATIPLHETFHFIEIPVIRFAEVRPQGPFRRDRGKINGIILSLGQLANCNIP